MDKDNQWEIPNNGGTPIFEVLSESMQRYFFRHMKINTMEELQLMTDKELLRCWNMGEVKLKKIRDWKPNLKKVPRIPELKREELISNLELLRIAVKPLLKQAFKAGGGYKHDQPMSIGTEISFEEWFKGLL